MKLQRIAYLLAATLVLGLAVGCDKKKEEEQVQKGDLLIQVLVSNPDGWSGSCFIQMVDSKAGKTYDNSNAFQVGYGLIGREIGKYLYFFPDYGKNSIVDRFYIADGVCTRISRTHSRPMRPRYSGRKLPSRRPTSPTWSARYRSLI